MYTGLTCTKANSLIIHVSPLYAKMVNVKDVMEAFSRNIDFAPSMNAVSI